MGKQIRKGKRRRGDNTKGENNNYDTLPIILYRISPQKSIQPIFFRGPMPKESQFTYHHPVTYC